MSYLGMTIDSKSAEEARNAGAFVYDIVIPWKFAKLLPVGDIYHIPGTEDWEPHQASEISDDDLVTVFVAYEDKL
jgi:hypothetical protein